MTTRSKRAAGAPSDPESNIDFTGEQQPILGNFDAPSASNVIIIQILRYHCYQHGIHGTLQIKIKISPV